MRNRESITLFATLSCAFFLACPAPEMRGQNEEPTTLAFQNLDSKSIIAQLEEYENKEFGRSIQYKAFSSMIPSAKADPRLTMYAVTCSNGRRLVESIDPKTGSKTTYARSEFGQFSVNRGTKQDGGDSKLGFFDAGQDLKKALEFEKRGFGMQIPVLLPLTGLNKLSWADFFQKEVGLKFSNYRASPSGNIELDFKSDSFVGSISLLSARNPVVIKSIRTRANLNMVTTTARVLLPSQAFDQMPRCQNLVVIIRSTVDGSEMARYKYEFSEYSAEDVPEKQFYLSSYGLPDPEGVPAYSKRSNRWIWLTSAAVVLFSISLLLRWMVRRRASIA